MTSSKRRYDECRAVRCGEASGEAVPDGSPPPANAKACRGGRRGVVGAP